VPSFARLLGRREQPPHDRLGIALGAVLIVVAMLAVQVALGLDFDPRYRDFPFAPLTAAAVPFLLLGVLGGRGAGRRGAAGRRAAAEIATAAVLGLSAIYIAFNESFANWQALWFCGVLLMLCVTLLRVRDAPGSE
jgi:peptidoglycan/LPS O-acetylase OafA/YrhL